MLLSILILWEKKDLKALCPLLGQIVCIGYRMAIVEGSCTMARSSSFRSKLFIGWHKSIVSSDYSDTMVWFGQILLYFNYCHPIHMILEILWLSLADDMKYFWLWPEWTMSFLPPFSTLSPTAALQSDHQIVLKNCQLVSTEKYDKFIRLHAFKESRHFHMNRSW